MLYLNTTKERVDRLHARTEPSINQIENNRRFQLLREEGGYKKANCRFVNSEYVCYDKTPELPILTLQSELKYVYKERIHIRQLTLWRSIYEFQ